MSANVKENKTRIIFTCSKDQYEFLKELSKKLNLSIGATIRRLLRQNIGVLCQRAGMTDEEYTMLRYTCQIAQTKWLNDEEDE